MPYFEFECKGCHKTQEILVLPSEKAPKKCPKCGGKLEKLMSASAFHLKGSGWYKTDYASGNSTATSSPTTEKKETPKTSGESTGSCESGTV